MSKFFISGIDTDIGKTYATGILAKALYDKGGNVITQKLVQTGCTGIAEDIIKHRQMMEIPLQEVDKQGLTCPYVFTKPASPHLSAVIEDTIIDTSMITNATASLSKQYDIILIEGAGGLMVPLTNSLLTIDYIASQDYPVILVTSGRLGSISHTLLSIESLAQRNIRLEAVIYNQWQPEKHLVSDYKPDAQITDSTKNYLQAYLNRQSPSTHWVDLPKLDSESALVDTQSLSRYAEGLIT